MNSPRPRVATLADAVTVARLLDAFNREYHVPTPGPEVLATRLRCLLSGTDVIAVLAGDPAVAVALMTLRPNIWYDGPVGLVDELYVAPEARGLGINVPRRRRATRPAARDRVRGGRFHARSRRRQR
jgi:hypothetical protein